VSNSSQKGRVINLLARGDGTQQPSGVRRKIRSLPELAEVARQGRATGQKVVLAHGVFDLIHMGHVRHLEAARRHGDTLIVTLTSDNFVNKGPGRPAFPEHLRAEMLAALEYVDLVGINDGSDACAVIRTIRPDVYIKGTDYADATTDVTGKIVAEREAVEAYGGKLVFTDEITFSSSNLINRYLSVFDPDVQTYLDDMRREGKLDVLLELIERVRNYRVLFVGDTIIDEYNYVRPLGKSPKENMIATLYQDREVFAGGVIAAANHCASFCADVEVITSLDTDDKHEELVRNSLKSNVRLTPIHRQGSTTTCKSRFVDPTYVRKLFEVYHMNDAPLSDALKDTLNGLIAERTRDVNLVVVTDFGHGLIGPDTINQLMAAAPFLAVNTQTNSANIGFNLITKYPRADYICIDEPEARLAVGDKYSELTTITSNMLSRRVPCPNIIVTHGRKGCVVHSDGMPTRSIPALTQSVVDTVGAGDAFLSVTSPLVAAGGNLTDVGFVGNLAGAVKVGIVGHRTSVDKPNVVKAITAMLK
jgi:rfaE bifunctional protein nucleotidyltransferase chain/domain